MNLKDSILKNTSLDEGIKWFKDSDKVMDIIHKIENGLKYEEMTEKQKKKIKILINYLRRLYTKLDKLEVEYKNSDDKENAKKKYEDLKKDYKLMFKEYGINTFLNIASIIGIGSLTALLSFFLTGVLFPDDMVRQGVLGRMGSVGLSVGLTPLVVSLTDKNLINRTEKIITAIKKDLRKQGK